MIKRYAIGLGFAVAITVTAVTAGVWGGLAFAAQTAACKAAQ